MSTAFRFFEYLCTSIGICLAATGFAVMSDLFRIGSPQQSIFSVVLAGLLCLALSLIIVQLARSYPSSPGVRAYLRDALGDHVSMIFTLMQVSVVVLFAGVESYIFYYALSQLIDVSAYLVCPALILAVMMFNLLGKSVSVTVQMTTTCILLVSLVCLGVTPLWVDNMTGVDTLLSVGQMAAVDSPLSLLTSAGTAIFLYMGFEWVLSSVRHPKDMQCTVPLAMASGLCILTLAYFLFINTLALYGDASAVTSTAIPHLLMAQIIVPEYASVLIALVSLLALVSTFNAGLIGVSRLTYGLGREGAFPKLFARISLTTGAPIGAIWVLGSVALLLCIVQLHYGIHIEVATVSAAIYCFIYSLYPISLLIHKAKNTSSTTRHMLALAIPLIAVSLTFLIFGFGALLSSAEHMPVVLGVFVIVSVLSILATVLMSRSVAGKHYNSGGAYAG